MRRPQNGRIRNAASVSLHLMRRTTAEVQTIAFKAMGMDIMKRRPNFSLNALLSAFGAFVILCLFTAGICAALRRKLIA